jgi:hypothetical protein
MAGLAEVRKPGAVLGLRAFWRPGLPVLTRRRLVMALGLLWVLDGALQLQPYMYGGDFALTLIDQTMGSPNPVTDFMRVLISFTYGSDPAHEAIFNTLAAAVQLVIGALLVMGRLERLVLVASFAWGLVPWLDGEGLGGMLYPQASMFIVGAPGAALVYSLLSLVLWPKKGALDGPAEGPSPTSAAGPVAGEGLLGHLGACWGWATIWVGTGLLELEYSNWAPNAIAAQLRYDASVQPGWLAVVGRAAAHLAQGRGTAIAFGLLVAQVLVGVWALRPATRRLALLTGVVLSLLYWVVGQDFGGVFTGQGTDPNLGPVMVLFALALWPRRRGRPEVAWVVQRPAWLEPARWRLAGHLALSTVVLGGILFGFHEGALLSQAAERKAAAGEPRIGARAPDGSFVTLTGAKADLSTEPHPMLLWFIATWCESCEVETKAEVSRLATLRRHHIHVVELELAGDFSSFSPSTSLQALRHFAAPYVKDPGSDSGWTWGLASARLSRAYDPRALLDLFYLVGTNGRVIKRGQDPTAWVP